MLGKKPNRALVLLPFLQEPRNPRAPSWGDTGLESPGAFLTFTHGETDAARLTIKFPDSKWSHPRLSPYPIPVNPYKQLEQVLDVRSIEVEAFKPFLLLIHY